MAQRNQVLTQVALAATGILGFAFLLLELSEFGALVAAGNGPSRSGFLTGFFSLVGCHGIHVTVGLLWLGTMMAQFLAKGFRADIRRRFLREGYAANSVKHPGAVLVVDDDVAEDGSAFLVMELLDGVACDRLQEQRGGPFGYLGGLDNGHRESLAARPALTGTHTKWQD